MDITAGRKSKREKSEYTLEKSLPDKVAQETDEILEETFVVDGKVYKMAPDLKDLPECDWDDPESQRRMKERDEQRIERYGRLTAEEIDRIYAVQDELMKADKDLSTKGAFDLAWKKVTKRKLPPDMTDRS